MPISFEDAKKQVNPELNDEEKDSNGLTAADRSALAIVAGTAANEAYWDSRGRLEQLEAAANGHGIVQRGSDSDAEMEALPTGSETGQEAVTDGTLDTEPVAAMEAGPEHTSGSAPAPAPDNPVEAVAVLRKQLEDRGIKPEV